MAPSTPLVSMVDLSSTALGRAAGSFLQSGDHVLCRKDGLAAERVLQWVVRCSAVQCSAVLCSALQWLSACTPHPQEWWRRV